MSPKFPLAPPLGTPMLAARPSPEARRLLALRKSANKHAIAEPGPPPAEVDELLQVAMRVPDHRRLAPWRFIVFEGSARAAFGKALADIAGRRITGAEARDVIEAAGLMLRAPVVVAIVSSPDVAHRTPVWEQELSAGAVCQNLLVAANAAGWAATWLTEWPAYDPDAARALGLAANERIAGFVYIGTACELPQERLRPAPSALISRWTK